MSDAFGEPLLREAHSHKARYCRSLPRFISSIILLTFAATLSLLPFGRLGTGVRVNNLSSLVRPLQPPLRGIRAGAAVVRQPLGITRPRTRVRSRATEHEFAPAVWRAGPVDITTSKAQFAQNLLREDPSLFGYTVDEELEALRKQFEEQSKHRQTLNSSAEDDFAVLRRRMDEIRQKERAKAVAELLYLRVCEQFRKRHVPLLPTMKAGGKVEVSAIEVKRLTTGVFSHEAWELMREKLSQIFGISEEGGEPVVTVAKLQAGQLYSAFATLGYDLRQVEARYQLERVAGNGDSLKAFISSFTPEEARRLKEASVEGQIAVESQVAALFGDIQQMEEQVKSEVGNAATPEEQMMRLKDLIKDNVIESLHMKGDDFSRLALEGVAFGALLHDAEEKVGYVYPLTSQTRARPLFGQLSQESDAAGFTDLD